MNKKIILSLLFFSMIILILLGYVKYQKYIPTTNIQTTSLSQNDIVTIKSQTPITDIKVDKTARIMKLLHHNQTIRSYPIRLGFDPSGHKIKEGDGKTPEGRYIIDWRNSKSAFYKSLHISYPNPQDIANAKKLGVSAGGNIMIHGSATTAQLEKLPSLMQYLPRSDWTWGCIAVRNVDMDEIWNLVDNQTLIHIYK